MSYNIFSNIISNVSNDENNVRAVVQDEITEVQNTIETTITKYAEVIVQNLSEYNGEYRQLLSKRSLDNNVFSPSSYNCYKLVKSTDLYYLIIFVVGSGWTFVHFNIDPELMLDLTIDLTDYIDTSELITNQTKFFGSSTFPKTVNISYN